MPVQSSSQGLRLSLTNFVYNISVTSLRQVAASPRRFSPAASPDASQI
jgi:hypothetical protein